MNEEVVPQTSIHAMCGSVGFQTMRVNGHVGKKTIHILINSGSTHNFLDEKLAKTLGCILEPMVAQSITIAGDNQLQCHYICRNFN